MPSLRTGTLGLADLEAALGGALGYWSLSFDELLTHPCSTYPWASANYFIRRKFGKPAIEEISRGSICTVAPGCPNRYLDPLIGPITVIPVAPVYS